MFVDEEAAVSEDEEVSEDEAGEGLDEFEAEFIDDGTQAASTVRYGPC